MKSLTRRITLKLLALGGACLGLSRTVRGDDQALTSDTDPLANSPELNTTVSWSRTHDRVWLNPRIWANPMEDWRIRDGAAECQTTGGNRNLHLITHQWTNPTGSADMRVSLQKIGGQRKDAGAGFRIGTKSELNEYRSNCFANGGINAGVLEGKLVLGRNAGSKSIDLGNETTLRLTARGLGAQVELTLIAETPSGKLLDQLTAKVQSKAVLGNVSLVNNFDAKLKKGQGGRYRFKDWSVTGNAFTIQESRQFGPILWSMYSLSDSRSDEGFVLKISALTGPLGKQDNQNIELQVKVDGDWKSLGQAALDTDAWTATFRIPNWNEKAATPYRLLYRELKTDGTEEESNWSGTIKANPAGRPLRIGALTCQNHYGFPYEPVAENIVRLETAAGVVVARAQCKGGKCVSVSLSMPASYVEELDHEISETQWGMLTADIAYGGVFYAILDADQLGLKIEPAQARDLVVAGMEIKNILNQSLKVSHPENPDINGIAYVMFRGQDEDGAIRTATTMWPGRLDRSPCGTGNSANLAIRAARGEVAEGDNYTSRSTIGSEFNVKHSGATMVGNKQAVLPIITGSGWIFGMHQIGVDPTDPFAKGFALTDT